jgi:hypothetical protein
MQKNDRHEDRLGSKHEKNIVKKKRQRYIHSWCFKYNKGKKLKVKNFASGFPQT